MFATKCFCLLLSDRTDLVAGPDSKEDSAASQELASPEPAALEPAEPPTWSCRGLTTCVMAPILA